MQSERITVKACLAPGALPRLEQQMLLAHVLGKPRVWLIAHDDYALSEAELGTYQGLCQRRMAGEPVAYLIGEREFMGLVFDVGPAVLIPRPETELLVQIVLDAIAKLVAPRVLDLGTGSGAIAVAVAHARPDALVWATDISVQALDVAHRNALRHDVDIRFAQGSWFDALAGQSAAFDVIVSNPPYIAAGDSHLAQGDLRHEPKQALTDGADGLSVYRTLARDAKHFLLPNGRLCIEHGFDQASPVAQLLEDAGFSNIKTIQDLAGHPRVTTSSYNGASL